MIFDPVKFAIVSPGNWGRQLLESIRSSTKMKFSGVFSRNAENSDGIVKVFGGKKFSTFESILKSPEVEAVILPTPHFLHFVQTRAALLANKHVFVEKPIANSVSEAIELRKISDAKNLVLSVGLQLRRTGAIRKAKQILEREEIGAIIAARAAVGAALLPKYERNAWQLDPEKNPGGPLNNLAIHYADVLQYLFGPVQQVSGFIFRSSSDNEIPRAASAVLKFRSGLIADFLTHQNSAYLSEISVFGEEAALHVKRAGQELFIEESIDPAIAKKSQPKLRKIPADGPHPFSTALTEELEEFADCIRTGKTPEVGVNEGIQSLKVICAVHEADKNSSIVEI